MTQTPQTSKPNPLDQRTAPTAAVLVLGEGGGLGAALLRRLQQSGTPATSALDLRDGEASERLREGHWRAVAVVTRDDAHALRLTLLSAHVRPDLPLWVTMFDHTVSRELEHVAPKVHVLSPSEIVAGDLAEGCLALAGDDIVGRRAHGVRLVDDALRLLVAAGAGLFGALAIEMVITMIAFHHGLVDAFYFSTRSVATVAGPPGADEGAAWFKIVSAANMVLAVALVAIERDAEAPSVRLARAAGIPVAIGRGDDRETLQRVGIERCGALAAVTSDDSSTSPSASPPRPSSERSKQGPSPPPRRPWGGRKTSATIC